MDTITIRGYKSIKDATVELRPINILIGANGAGKSNFLSFFDFLNNLYHQDLKEYVALNGGIDKMLFQGKKVTEAISAYLSFRGQLHAYSFTLKHNDVSFIFVEEELWYTRTPQNISTFNTEAQIKYEASSQASYVRSHLNNIKKHHFHDTGRNSPFNKLSHIESDTFYLYERGGNIAAFLYHIRETELIVYQRIIKTIQSIAPCFSDFFLQPNAENYIRLQWKDKRSSVLVPKYWTGS